MLVCHHRSAAWRGDDRLLVLSVSCLNTFVFSLLYLFRKGNLLAGMERRKRDEKTSPKCPLATLDVCSRENLLLVRSKKS